MLCAKKLNWRYMILAVIQARMGSTRLPGKTLMKIGGKTLLEYCLTRVRLSKKIDKIVVATTTNSEDKAVEKFCESVGVDCFRGLPEDVLDRYWQCTKRYSDYQTIIRITGDCPVIDPVVIDAVIEKFFNEKLDYASNVLEETFPDGMDVEVFTLEALAEAAQKAKLGSEREHVTLYIRNQPDFKKGNLAADKDYSQFRLTVDQSEDFEVVKFVIENAKPDTSYKDYIKLLLKHPEIFKKNSNVVRNEGMKKSLNKDKKLLNP